MEANGQGLLCQGERKEQGWSKNDGHVVNTIID